MKQMSQDKITALMEENRKLKYVLNMANKVIEKQEHQKKMNMQDEAHMAIHLMALGVFDSTNN
jgi:hypothetical protein